MNTRITSGEIFPSSQVPRRLQFLDRAKGIGILLVVLFHAWRGLLDSYPHVGGVLMRMVDYTVYLFHMPLFFILSGMLAERSLAKGRGSYLIGKLVSLYWPYLLWSIVTIGFIILLPSLTDHGFGWRQMRDIPFQPRIHLWFLFTLFLYSVLYAAMPQIKFLLPLAIVMAFVATLDDLRPFAQYLSNLVFFVAGLAGPVRWRAALRWWPAALAVLLGSAAAGMHFGLSHLSWPLAPAGLAGTLTILAASNRIAAGGWLDRLLTLLGTASLAIYILHHFLVGSVRAALQQVVPTMPGEVVLLACLIVGIIVPVAVQRGAVRLGVSRWLGLGKG